MSQFESPSLTDELAQSLGHTLDSMLPKERFMYVLVVQPLDLMRERLTIGNSTVELSNRLLEVALDSVDGEVTPLVPPS